MTKESKSVSGDTIEERGDRVVDSVNKMVDSLRVTRQIDAERLLFFFKFVAVDFAEKEQLGNNIRESSLIYDHDTDEMRDMSRYTQAVGVATQKAFKDLAVHDMVLWHKQFNDADEIRDYLLDSAGIFEEYLQEELMEVNNG